MSRSRFLCLAAFLGLAAAGGFGPVHGQGREVPTPEEVQAAETAPLFSSLDVLHLTLEADFHTIRREDRSPEDSQERPAILKWTNEDGSEELQEVQIQTRGNFRLSSRNCDFPPLRLNVKKGTTKGTVFDGQDKLKIVVPCKLGQDYWEQYVLSEYLTYRMLNLLTPLSFRVRLARISYVDTSGEDDTVLKYSFMIEDNDALATRNGGWKIDWNMERDFHPAQLDPHQAILAELFQFMIGNTDWSGVRMHNVELFQRPPEYFAIIPFDFDISGIVDSRYARPDATLPIQSVRDRLFRGFCPEQVGREPADYEGVYEAFREKKEEIYALWRNLEGLEEDRANDTLDFLDEFYGILESPRRIQSNIMDHCRRIGSP